MPLASLPEQFFAGSRWSPVMNHSGSKKQFAYEMKPVFDAGDWVMQVEWRSPASRARSAGSTANPPPSPPMTQDPRNMAGSEDY